MEMNERSEKEQWEAPSIVTKGSLRDVTHDGLTNGGDNLFSPPPDGFNGDSR